MNSQDAQQSAAELSPKLLLLDERDNVYVATASIAGGETLALGQRTVIVNEDIGVGHKVARQDLATGTRVIKYGAPIGSMIRSVGAGQHVHTQDMKSDYIPSHSRNQGKR